VAEIERMIRECRDLRAYHIARRNSGVRGAGIEALAVAIRERALRDALAAITPEGDTAPGHTDLMVSPESIEEYFAALPAEKKD